MNENTQDFGDLTRIEFVKIGGHDGAILVGESVPFVYGRVREVAMLGPNVISVRIERDRLMERVRTQEEIERPWWRRFWPW